MMYTVVVTGITGKSGKSFLKNLVENAEKFSNYHFILVCREKSIDEIYVILKESYLSLEVIVADLKQTEAIERVFSQCVNMLFHIAGIYTTLDIVPIAVKHGVHDYVLVHTSGIFSKYKSAKCEYEAIEEKVRSLLTDQNVTILRPTMIYGDLKDGNVSTFIRMIDSLPIMPVISGARCKLQPVWSDDVGKAYYQVLYNWNRTKNKEYILSGKEPIELVEMFRIISEQLNKKFRYFSVPFPIAYFGAVLLWLFSLCHIDYREQVQRMVESRTYSHKQATIEFSYDPVSFEDGVKEEIELYKRRRD